jgi:hypothetical protein
LKAEEFDFILPSFSKELEWKYCRTSRGKFRQNSFKWRKELPSGAHHLFFLLTYLKENPTQEFHGAIFGISQESVSQIIRDCLSAFNLAMASKKLLPCMNGADFTLAVESLKRRYPENPMVSTTDVLMDCTEVKVQRPKDKGEQKDCYSGKKKLHTVKKLVVSLFCGYILMSSHHFTGKVSDKKMADIEQINFPKGTFLWTDLGFIGYQNEDISLIIPNKKPKNGERTDLQKEENQVIASYRVKNEHAIGGMKRCRIMKDTIRIHGHNTRDDIFASCAGLHNLRVVFRNI